LKESAERLQHDADVARNKEASAQEQVRKLQRALREAKEAQANSESKEAIELARKRELEKRLEQAETELASTKADLKLALQRVDDLQCAIQGDLDDNEDEPSDR
jgi:myosin-18